MTLMTNNERGMPMPRKFDSTVSRVIPVFDRVTKDADWLPRLIALLPRRPSEDAGNPLRHPAYGENEVGLLAPASLLSWLVRNFDRDTLGTDATSRARQDLRDRNPSRIQEALTLLRKGELDRQWYILEGRTRPDVFIETSNALIVIEGKRTEAGPTRDTEYMTGRHQIWRHMDAAWEIRGNRRVYGFFIVEADESAKVPKTWQDYDAEVMSASVLASSFPHRSTREVQGITSGYLGATTWQRVAKEFGIDYLPHYAPGYIPNAYRVPNTNIIAGEYPFDKDPARGLARIRTCLDAGITHFLDITQPIDGLLSYRVALEGETSRRGLTVKYTNIGVRDGGTPTDQVMRDILNLLDAASAAGEVVYLHCWGGVGRTGTIVGAYLRNHGTEPDAAIAKVEKLFRTTDKWERHGRTSFHTEAQKDFVRNWASRPMGVQ